MNISVSDWIQIFIALITLIGVLVSTLIAIKTLKKNNNTIEE